MDTLTKKIYKEVDYQSRYAAVPSYFDTLNKREIMGIGSNMKSDTTYVSHRIVGGDTLDKLALHYYNNPTYWWIIAYFNDIQDPFKKLSVDQILKIPRFTNVVFGKERK